ncbi:MFS transporter [Fodinicola feengrottensis]|uniref:hypothetical protein n=1 Tax=Fodinicola feengrottensis TaxID=435914 RepID=UPI002442FB4B|nr:hypothetical protein [Fodinicola feengrottensis]
MFRQSWQGNLRLLSDRSIRRLLFAQWLPAMFVTGAEALVIPYAAERGFPAGTTGFLLACVPVGMLSGNLAVGRLARPSTRERLVAPLIALCGAPLLAMSLGLPLLAVGALLAVTGCGFAYSLGLQRRFRDAVDESMRGQAFGLLSTGLMTLQGTVQDFSVRSPSFCSPGSRWPAPARRRWRPPFGVGTPCAECNGTVQFCEPYRYICGG